MIELVYRSVAKEGISQSDIEMILSTARKFNIDNEITGCLLFFNNKFIQILEGKEDKVKELFKNIQADLRHTHVQLITQNKKENRIFKGWSMAYYKFENENFPSAKKQLFVKNLITFSESNDKHTQGIKLFWKYVKSILKEMN